MVGVSVCPAILVYGCCLSILTRRACQEILIWKINYTYHPISKARTMCILVEEGCNCLEDLALFSKIRKWVSHTPNSFSMNLPWTDSRVIEDVGLSLP